ncbi:MATE family efflux transporter, partial [candidate division KSB1 bacterium]
MKFDKGLTNTILRLSYPVMIGMMSRTLLSFTDTIMAGRLGAAAIASVGLGSVTAWILIFTFFSLGTGTQIMTSRKFGEGNMRECGAVLQTSSVFSVTIALFAILSVFMVTDKIFFHIAKDPLVYNYGSVYVKIRIFEIISFTIITVFSGFFNGIGNMKIHMRIMLVVNLLNIVLNYLLIFGKFGFPRLEVTGAAFGSTISTYVGAIVVIIITLRRKYLREFLYFRKFEIRTDIIKSLVRLAYPTALKNFLILIGYTLFLKYIGIIGTKELAASNISLTITNLSWMPGVGIGTAATTLVGRSLGAGKSELAERYGWESIKISVLIMGSIGVIFFAFPQLILRVFTNDIEVIQKGIAVLRILGAVQFLD